MFFTDLQEHHSEETALKSSHRSPRHKPAPVFRSITAFRALEQLCQGDFRSAVKLLCAHLPLRPYCGWIIRLPSYVKFLFCNRHPFTKMLRVSQPVLQKPRQVTPTQTTRQRVSGNQSWIEGRKKTSRNCTPTKLYSKHAWAPCIN